MHLCARIHDHGQLFGLITCSEHRKFLTNHTSSRPGESRESRCSGRLRRSTPPGQPHFPSLHCCSHRVVPLQMMTKPELKSTQLAQKRKNSLDTMFVFLPLLPLPQGLESKLLCENLHLSPRAQVPLAKCLQGIVALYAPLCDHLWHSFPFQLRCR